MSWDISSWNCVEILVLKVVTFVAIYKKAIMYTKTIRWNIQYTSIY